MRYAIFQINTDLLKIFQNFNNFTQGALYSSFISKKSCCFPSKHRLSTTFSLFLTISEVCNNSNKYWLPNKLAKNMFLHKTTYIPPSFQENFALSIAEAFTNITFYHMHTNFCSEWDVNISNKYQPRSNLAKGGALHRKPFRNIHFLQCFYYL